MMSFNESQSEFTRLAREIFSCLSQYDFCESIGAGSAVSYIKGDVVIVPKIERGNLVNLELHLSDFKCALKSLLMLEAPELFEKFRCRYALSPQLMSELLIELRDLLLRYGQEILAANKIYLNHLKTHCEHEWHLYRTNVLARTVRLKIGAVSGTNNDEKVVELYAKIKDVLSPVELSIFEDLKKELGAKA